MCSLRHHAVVLVEGTALALEASDRRDRLVWCHVRLLLTADKHAKNSSVVAAIAPRTMHGYLGIAAVEFGVVLLLYLVQEGVLLLPLPRSLLIPARLNRLCDYC